jgi:DNA-binding MarR family transcriptional regulator
MNKATAPRAGRRRSSKPRVLTDPRAIRALAHPARLTVLEALADGEELTATSCAEVAGITPSAMSYHLRALEKWGFVERATSATDGRERPWRSTASGWRVEAMPDAVAATATTAVVSSMLDRLRGDLADYFPREQLEPKHWRDVAAVENQRLWLTADEARQLQETYNDFVEARRGRTAADHPPGARRVRLTRVLVPLDQA